MFAYNVKIEEIIIDGSSVRNISLSVISESNSRPTSDEVKEQVQRMYGGCDLRLSGNRWNYSRC